MVDKVLTKPGNNPPSIEWHHNRSLNEKGVYNSLNKNIIDALNKNFASGTNTTFEIKPNDEHPVEIIITMYGDNRGKFTIPGWVLSYCTLSNATIKGTENNTKEELDITDLIEYILINRLSKDSTKDLIKNYLDNGIIDSPLVVPTGPAAQAPIIIPAGLAPPGLASARPTEIAALPATAEPPLIAASPANAVVPGVAVNTLVPAVGAGIPAGLSAGLLAGLPAGLPLPALPPGDYTFDLTALEFPYLLSFDKKLTELKDKRKKLEFHLIMDDKHFDLALSKVMLLRSDYENFNSLSDTSKRNNHTLALILLGILVKQNEGVDLAKLFLSSKK